MKRLKRKHKAFLAQLGLKSKDYRFIKEDWESYTFWSIPKERVEVMRR